MRKIFIAFILVAAAVAVIVHQLQSPKFWQYALDKSINGRNKNVSIKEIAIEQVKWHSLNRVSFSSLRAKLKVHGSTYFISSGEINLQGIGALLTSNQQFNAAIKSVAVVSDTLNVSTANIRSNFKFNGASWDYAQGQMDALSMEIGEYQLTDVKTDFNVNKVRLNFENLHANAYKGRLKAEGSLDYAPELKLETSIVFETIDLKELSKANEGVFGGMEGKAHGHLNLKGSLNHIESFNAHVNIPQGGTVSAKVFSFLAQILPKGNVFRQPLDRLLDTQKPIPIDNGAVAIASSGEGKYKGQINIYSPKAALDLKYTYDLNLEDGLSNLVKFISVLLKR